MNKQIEVEKSVGFLEDSKKYSISLRTVEPYGEYYPKTIYVTGIFHKKLDKALEMAWAEFNKSKTYQDNDDTFRRNMSNETVKVAV